MYLYDIYLKMATKKIVNTKTHKAYAIRQRTTKNGRKWQIKWLYKVQKASTSVSRNFWDVIKQLSTE